MDPCPAVTITGQRVTTQLGNQEAQPARSGLQAQISTIQATHSAELSIFLNQMEGWQ